MKEIRIGPMLQLLLMLSVVGAVVAAVLAQLPELQRYLKIRSM